ncbi:hypothetical protein T4D_14631 [Trichinella pseudospiralis]|uniref:Uncharacterized protein n=1 Tax=Trichinella pseudospiralis TaxID=6337 RepID=A0A0V1DKQ4_TRIPS|nr:hypothetical protein T4D_14631 [Trichinella pseudospiralis]
MCNEKFKSNLLQNYCIVWGQIFQNTIIYQYKKKFENFEKTLFFQKWTKWVLIDSE